MAVKKAIAKRSVAKKAAAKKVTAKRAATKIARPKATTKKSTVKKSAAKKSAVKKSSVKKSAVKKSSVKKSAVKKKAASKASKKTTLKKAAKKKIAAKKGAEAIIIPEAPISVSRNARVEIVSTPAPAAPIFVAAAATPTPTSEKKPGASGRVIFAVVVGIILLGLIVWAKGHNTNSNKAAPTPTATASTTPSITPSASPTPSASDTSATLTAHEAPQGVVAHYTATGATIFWKAPTALDGLSGYNVEISVSNGPWKLISTVPATQFSLDVKKENGTGWTSFKVSSVYTDAQTAPAKAFGLPGTYS